MFKEFNFFLIHREMPWVFNAQASIGVCCIYQGTRHPGYCNYWPSRSMPKNRKPGNYFGTGDVVSHIIVQDTGRKWRNIYISSNMCQITLRSNCMSQHFSIMIRPFPLRSALVCFVYFSEKIKIIFRNSITRFLFDMHCVFCEGESEFL